MKNKENSMSIVFISNFLNHHSLELCKALQKITKGNFKFVANSMTPEDKIKFGYEDLNERYDFVVRAYEEGSYQTALKLCLDCDVLVYGTAPKEIINKRLKRGKLTYKYSERVYKKKCPWYEMPLRCVKYFWEFSRHKNLYLLCASAYTARDYAKTGTFIKKAFKWGYFPETKEYNIDKLIAKKKRNSILWAGRLIDWKHPEYAVEVAHRLKNEGFNFSLDIIGSGDMEQELEEKIVEYGLQKHVSLLGAMSHQEVRTYMEESEVYLFTSDRQEGWGAVLNESMNSGCAVVASNAIGSVPFLVNDGENGLTYQDGNIDDLYKKVKSLLQNCLVSQQLGKRAYKTITTQWNAENAAERLVELSQTLMSKNKNRFIFNDGVCSKADI